MVSCCKHVLCLWLLSLSVVLLAIANVAGSVFASFPEGILPYGWHCLGPTVLVSSCGFFALLAVLCRQ
jgi:hypothetical protein